VVTADLERFKAIQPGEDHRFCELVNLVRRSYNILKEVKRPQDIDNTHVISLIEAKMSEIGTLHDKFAKMDGQKRGQLGFVQERRFPPKHRQSSFLCQRPWYRWKWSRLSR